MSRGDEKVFITVFLFLPCVNSDCSLSWHQIQSLVLKNQLMPELVINLSELESEVSLLPSLGACWLVHGISRGRGILASFFFCLSPFKEAYPGGQTEGREGEKLK